jgi:hypothetical protein
VKAHLVMIASLAACGGSQESAPVAKPPEAPAPRTESQEATPPAAPSGPKIDAPAGWALEREGEAIVIRAPASPAVIALTTLPLAATRARIQEEANALAATVDLTVRGSIRLKDLAEQSERAGSRKLALWELPYAEREGQMGAVMVFAGKLTPEAIVVGIAYAPNDEEATIEAILQAITTIRPGTDP